MLAPPGKYKKFVSLVMGFVLLGMMIAPLARFSTEIPLTEWLPFVLQDVEYYENAQTAYASWRETYLRDAFETQLVAQLTNLLEQNDFEVHQVGVSFSADFMQVTNVAVTLSRAEISARVPFIRIQPVQISPPGQEEVKTCAVAIDAKNIISQFYNVPSQHINVIVR